MKRVLLVYQPVTGGVARHLLDLARALPEHGYEAILCGPAVPAGAEGALRRSQHVELQLGRSVSPERDWRALRAYARIVRAIRPDLVHAHSSKAGAVARLGRLIAPKIPVMYTPHGFSFAGHFERRGARLIYRELERALMPATTLTIAVSSAEAALAASIGGRGRVRLVHNGIDPPTLSPVDPRARALAKLGPLICSVAELRPGKGLETLVDATPLVLERVPNARIAIVGDGPSRGHLEARVRTAGLESNFVFLGSRERPNAVLQAATVFAFPSWAESFPYAVLEAMALGLPLVATAVGGVGDAVRHEATGLLVGPKDPKDLASALVKLLESPHLRDGLGTAAAEVLRSEFSRERMMSLLATAYEEAEAVGRNG